MKKIMLYIIAVLAFTVISNAETNYYVSPSGDNNNSGLSLGQAYKTIQKAANVLQAGDTVFIKSGIYNEYVIPANSGDASNYITYTAYSGDTSIIDGSGFSYLEYSDRGVFDIKDKHYINIIGLTIRNSSEGGGIMCRYGSSHINIENNHISNCGATGIGVGYSRGEGVPLATNVTAKGNFLDSCSLIHRESISFRSVDTFAIFNNTVQNTPKEAIDAKSGCANGQIYNNFVSNAGAVGIYIDAGYTDPLYASSHNIHVYQNTVVNSKISYAVASERSCLGEDIWFYNNIAYDSSPPFSTEDGIMAANFGESGPLENIYIINNTIYGKGHRGIYINNLNVRDIFIRNNICSQNHISQIDVKSSLIDSVTLEYNLIYGSNVDYGDFPVIGNPGFISASSGDFHLTAGSPAIDNGTSVDAPIIDFDGVIRPSGDEYDIGAYEYLNTTSINDKDKIDDFRNPAAFQLTQNYPNPFNSSTTISYHMAKAGHIKITILNMLGQEMATLVNGHRVFGAYNIHWSGVNMPSGIYFCRMQAEDAATGQRFSESRKLLLQK